jgi:nucleoside-diphosphate-sugar epimerase
MLVMVKFVVTGSSGRIGGGICDSLSPLHTVFGIDKLPSNQTTHNFDITNHSELKRTFEGADTVFHSAALHAPHVLIHKDSEFYHINVEGTQTVIAAAKAAGVRKLVFTSTTALYGYASQLSKKTSWIDENTKPEPRTIYHQTKLEAESILSAEANDNFKVSVIRMSRCFPEPAPLMATYRLHRGVDARDVAKAHILASLKSLKNFDVFVVSGKTPFLSTDAEQLKVDAQSVIRERCPEIALSFDRRGWNLPDSIDRVYDASYANEILNFQTRYGFDDVIGKLDGGCTEVLAPSASGSCIAE